MKTIYLSLAIMLISFSSFGQLTFKAFISDDIETIKFINLSRHDASNPYMLFYWDLGDGVECFAGKELTHYYEAPGTYEISLIGITKNGTRDTLKQALRIPEDLELLTDKNVNESLKTAQSLSNLKPTTKQKAQEL